MRRRVMVTGATGYVAQQILPRLQERYEVILTDVSSTVSTGTLAPTQGDWTPEVGTLDDVHELDLLADDSSRLSELMQGIDTVVHLAYKPPSGHADSGGDLLRNAQWLYDGESDNIDMAQRIYQVALESDVRRVVIGSSNHASHWYEVPFHQGLKQRVSPSDLPKTDSFYGWSKLSYEMLGFLYACGALGRQLEVVALRIVAPRPIELKGFVGMETRHYMRDVAGYISSRDMAQLVERSIDAETISDEFGVPWLVTYAVSNNDRKFWGIENARRILSYAPRDNSEIQFAEEIRRVLDSGQDVITADLVQ